MYFASSDGLPYLAREGGKLSATGGPELPDSRLRTGDRIGKTCYMKPVIAIA